MYRKIFAMSMVMVYLSLGISCAQPGRTTGETIKLPEPKHKGEVSVEEAIYRRRSLRRYSIAPLSVEEVAQLLWAACSLGTLRGKYDLYGSPTRQK